MYRASRAPALDIAKTPLLPFIHFGDVVMENIPYLCPTLYSCHDTKHTQGLLIIFLVHVRNLNFDDQLSQMGLSTLMYLPSLFFLEISTVVRAT